LKGYGKKIKELRKRRKWSQEFLGEKIGVSNTFISKIENEVYTPSLETLNDIAKILEVDFLDLFEKKEPPQELKDAGAKWIVIGEELEKAGISPEQVKMWAEIIKKHTENN
jgi:transcriptional regulator with XRE-family HTH domain